MRMKKDSNFTWDLSYTGCFNPHHINSFLFWIVFLNTLHYSKSTKQYCSRHTSNYSKTPSIIQRPQNMFRSHTWCNYFVFLSFSHLILWRFHCSNLQSWSGVLQHWSLGNKRCMFTCIGETRLLYISALWTTVCSEGMYAFGFIQLKHISVTHTSVSYLKRIYKHLSEMMKIQQGKKLFIL